MRVLLLTQVLPFPPDSGPKIKTWNVIKYLVKRHEVTLVSFVRGDQSADVAHLQDYCRSVHTVPMERNMMRDGLAMARSVLTRQPWMMVRDDRSAMRDLVDRLCAEQHFDIAHADQLNMGQYAARAKGAFRILDAHNALWLLYKRLWRTMPSGPGKWLLARDWRLLKVYEGKTVRQFEAVIAVSQEDRSALQEAAGCPVDVAVIPIAIDTDEVTVVERVSQPNHILHMGTMYWPPNADAVKWFVHEVYPIIRQQRPQVHFDVVGSRPPAELLALSGNDTGVNVVGYVEYPIQYRQEAAVMVVPLRAGGGMRVKILNALAEGIPVVSTTLGCEGIQVTDGKDILVADEPSGFAEAVLRVMSDPALAKRLSDNGRMLVETRYDYRKACAPIDDVFARATLTKQRRI